MPSVLAAPRPLFAIHGIAAFPTSCRSGVTEDAPEAHGDNFRLVITAPRRGAIFFAGFSGEQKTGTVPVWQTGVSPFAKRE